MILASKYDERHIIVQKKYCWSASVASRSAELKNIFNKELKPHMDRLKTERNKMQQIVDRAKVGIIHLIFSLTDVQLTK